jgi:hypothetical protein
LILKDFSVALQSFFPRTKNHACIISQFDFKYLFLHLSGQVTTFLSHLKLVHECQFCCYDFKQATERETT